MLYYICHSISCDRYRDVIKDLAKEEGYDGVNTFVISLVNEVLKAKGREEIPTGIKGTKQREP